MNVKQKLDILYEYCSRVNLEICNNNMCKLSNMNCCFWNYTDDGINDDYEIIKDDKFM